jgi:hypothetical protein
MSQWDAYVERLRVQLPAAPPSLLNGYVRWAPWVAIVFGVIGFLLSLVLLGLGAVLSPLLLLAGTEGVRSGGSFFMAVALSIVLTVIDIVGGVQMLKLRVTGWWIVAAGLVIYLLQDLLGGNLLGLLITLLVAYIHVQVRPRYS